MLFGFEILGASALIAAGGVFLWKAFRSRNGQSKPQTIYIASVDPKRDR